MTAHQIFYIIGISEQSYKCCHKEQRIQKNLVSAACEEKIVAMTLDDKRDELNNEALVKEQKAVDEIAAQCWLRQKTLGLV